MDLLSLILYFVVFAAATLQSATGIGFGIIAGPILLVVLNDASAVFVSIVLNLLIATMLLYTSWRRREQIVLRTLLVGIAAGAPLGYILYTNLSLTHLKILAAVFVLMALTLMVFARRMQLRQGNALHARSQSIVAGIVAGIMGASLAMPGPVPAAWMAARGADKTTVRATIIVMFFFSYGLFLLIQLATVDIHKDTFITCARLALPTMAGVVLGHAIGRRMSERSFRWVVISVLLLTSATLLFNTGN